MVKRSGDLLKIANILGQSEQKISKRGIGRDIPRLQLGRKAPPREKWLWRWLTNMELWPLLVFLLIASFLSHFFVWLFLGRDSKERNVALRNLPPEGLSAGAAAYLARMKRNTSYDSTCFRAGVIGLAAKGAIRIEKTAGNSSNHGASDYVLHAEKKQHGPDEGRAALNQDESWLLEDLLGDAPNLELSKKNHKQILEAQTAHQESLEAQQEALNFRLNDGWILPGILIPVGVTWSILFGLNPWAGAIVAGMGVVWQLQRSIIPRRYSSYASLYSMLFVALISSGCVLLINDEELGDWPKRVDLSLALAFSALVYAGNVRALFLLKRLSHTGRQMLDQLEGFRLYLANEISAEDSKHGLHYRASQTSTFEHQEHTIGLFEKFLPYAVALNCAEQWASQFEDPESSLLSNVLGDSEAAFTRALAAACNPVGSGSGGSGGG